MNVIDASFAEKSRLRVLLGHFAVIEDPRESWRVAHPLPEVLLLVVCGTIADCDDYDAIAAWGEKHLPFLRRYLPYHFGVPGGRWLTLLMNRINPALFSAAFTAWVRRTWPERPDLVAIDGKTSRRSRDRAANKGPLHLVSAFATTSWLVLGQEAVEGKTAPVGAGRRLWGRPIPSPKRPRREKHGHRQTLSLQPRPLGQGQTKHQTAQTNHRMGSKLSCRAPQLTAALTRIRCPGKPRPAIPARFPPSSCLDAERERCCSRHPRNGFRR